MEQIDPDLLDAGQQLFEQAQTFLRDMAQPWQFYQAAILLALFGAAHLIRRWLGPRLLERVRAREGWPRWRLRLAIIVENRLRGVIFVVLAWSLYLVLEDLAPEARNYVIEVWAVIASAWVLVSFAGQLIRNRPLRRILTWAAWIYIALHFLGFLEQAANFLDSIAITVEDFRLSLLTVIVALLLTGLLIFLARLLTRIAVNRIEAYEDLSPSSRVLAGKAVQLVLFSLAIVIGLRALGFDLTALAVISGAIGLGIGFGLQKVVSNLFSGIVILLDKSIKPGDVISLGSTFGWVNQLGARYVSVVTRDGREYLIPNEDLVTGQMVNWSHSDEFVRLDLAFATSYGDDPHLVRRIAVEAARTVPRVLADRQVRCHITGFGDYSVNYLLRFWIADATRGLASVRGEIYLALWDAFKEHGITIPFPQREVKLLDTPPHGPAGETGPGDPARGPQAHNPANTGPETGAAR